MPASLDELNAKSRERTSNDPVTGAPYGYRVIEGDAYEVCATFDRASEQRVVTAVAEWQHDAGRHCFEHEAPDPSHE